MNQKSLFLAVALTALLVIGGVFWIIQQRPMAVKQPVVQTPAREELTPAKTDEVETVKDLIDGEYTFTPIDTSDWKTYRNDEFRYQLRFPRSIENTDQQSFIDHSGKYISFYIIPYERLREKTLNDILEDDLFDSTLTPFINSGNIEVSLRTKLVNGVDVVLVDYLFGKEPKNHDMEAWSEGSIRKEIFFQCGSDTCTIMTIADQFSQEKQLLFYTILSTLQTIE